MAEVASTQALVLGLILAYSGTGKLLLPGWQATARRSSLTYLMTGRKLDLFYKTLGGTELLVALLLLLPPAERWEMIPTSTLLLGFITYLGASAVVWKGRPCACMGESGTVAKWPPLMRAATMLMFALLAWVPHDHWIHTLSREPRWFALPSVELLLVALLSPDLRPSDFRRLFSNRQQAALLPRCATQNPPLHESMQLLHASRAFTELARYLGANPNDHWRDGCWRFFTFPAHYEGHDLVAVFAVPLSPELGLVRGTFVWPDRDDTLPALPLDIVRGAKA